MELLLNKDNVFISPLPLESVREECGSRELILRIFREFVSPLGSESIFSLYLAKGGSDPEILRKLKTLMDLFKQLIDHNDMEKRLDSVRALANTLQKHTLINEICAFSSLQNHLKVANKSTEVSSSLSRNQMFQLEKSSGNDGQIAPETTDVVPKAAFPSTPSPGSKGKAPPPILRPGLPKTGAPPFIPSPPPPVIAAGKAAPPLPLVGRIPPKVQPLADSSVVQEEVAIFPAPSISGEAETRRIHWQSIPVSRFKNSVFELEMFRKSCDYASVDTLIDFEKAKVHFVKPFYSNVSSPTASGAVSVISSSVASSPQQASVVPSILPVKRSQQIEIFLTGRKNVLSRGIQTIIKPDFEGLRTVDLLEAAAQLYPTDEEADLLRSKFGTEALPKAESFLLELISIPQFKLAVGYITVLLTAEHSVEKICKYFERVTDVIHKIVQSKPFVKFLKLIGIMVVYLSNGKKANFNGFSLESVTSLKKVSSFVEKEYSVLHLVVEAMNCADIETLLIDLSVLEDLMEYDFGEQVEKSVEVEKALNNIDPTRLEKDFHSDLISRLNQFSSHMTGKIARLCKLRDQVVSESRGLLRYLAENEKRNFHEVLVHLNEVRNDVATTKFQNERRKSKKNPR